MNTYLLLASTASSFAKYLSDKISQMGKDPSVLRTTFITTAANTYKEKPWMEEDIAKFEQVDFRVQRLDIANETEEHSKQILSETDICIVGGGNTIYLLEEILKKNLRTFFALTISAFVCLTSPF